MLWNMVYLVERAAHALRGHGQAIDDTLFQYLPLRRHGHPVRRQLATKRRWRSLPTTAIEAAWVYAINLDCEVAPSTTVLSSIESAHLWRRVCCDKDCSVPSDAELRSNSDVTQQNCRPKVTYGILEVSSR